LSNKSSFSLQIPTNKWWWQTHCYNLSNKSCYNLQIPTNKWRWQTQY
jgi:hypothetical protein